MMAAFMLSLVFFLAITGYSSASYCVCKDGVDPKILQENIDYACGSGADCTAIHQNGACYNPDTIKDHCSYAVNSYYQRKGASGASCDFKGSATLTSTAPTTGSGCVYQSTAGSTGGNTTPTTTPGTTNPSTGGTGTGTGSGTTTTVPGTNPVFGLGPSGMTNTDINGGTAIHRSSVFFTIALLFTSLEQHQKSRERGKREFLEENNYMERGGLKAKGGEQEKLGTIETGRIDENRTESYAEEEHMDNVQNEEDQIELQTKEEHTEEF
ncbi:hypothetical protein HAX54_041195 [Datura stramonium]|uniref:X8 domain-containing protein n=1 Tax=Datura stramonium TaxID=4076 RepID=A0ABS8SL05_DATST|nr:hypothetical protein [Datura stramonium]